MKACDLVTLFASLPPDAEVSFTLTGVQFPAEKRSTSTERMRRLRARRDGCDASQASLASQGDKGGSVSSGSEEEAEKSTKETRIGSSLTGGSSGANEVGDASQGVTSVTRRKRWRKVPDDWEPKGTHRSMAAARGIDFDLELAKFRDHEFASAKSDADATFRNWLRSARTTLRNGSSAPTAATLLAERARRIAAGEKP